MTLAANISKRYLLLLFFLGACSTDNEILSMSGQVFGTFYDIKFESSQHNLKRVNNEIDKIFIAINECCSTYKNDSLVSLKRDKKILNLLKKMLEIISKKL